MHPVQWQRLRWLRLLAIGAFVEASVFWYTIHGDPFRRWGCAGKQLETVRLVHSSDIHLGEDRFVDMGLPPDRAERALKALIDLSIQAEANLVVIAGDLFDNNRVGPAEVEFATTELARAIIPVVILPGNHDCLVPDSVYKRFALTELAPNVCIFTALEGEAFSFTELDLAVWGKPIDSYGGDLRPLEGIPPRGGELWQVAVAHGHYVGADAGQFHSFQISEAEILQSGRDYVALGHWDLFRSVCSDGVKAFYAGSTGARGTAAVVDLSEHFGVQVRPCPLPL